MSKDKGKIERLMDFLLFGIWRMRLDQSRRVRYFFFSQLRVFVLSVKGFLEDKCQLRASALTYFSILSVVPFVALAFGIAKGFGFEEVLQTQLKMALEGHEQTADLIIKFSQNMLIKAKGGLIAGVGVALLIWMILKVLFQIEESFNVIWGIQKARSYIRKFSDYLSFLLICPILFAVASTSNVFVSSRFALMAGENSALSELSPIVNMLLSVVPTFLLWVMFMFLYFLMPNTKVKFKSVIIPAILCGSIFQLAQWFYIKTQVFIASYGAIYGSFAALPLFMVWVQISWTIVLLGAEMSFSYQNVRTFEYEPDCHRASASFKKTVAVRIMHLIVKGFEHRDANLNSAEISIRLETPVRLVRMIIDDLVNAGMLTEVISESSEDATYQPAIPICNLKIRDVLSSLDSIGIEDLPVEKSPQLSTIKKKIAKLDELSAASEYNMLIRDID